MKQRSKVIRESQGTICLHMNCTLGRQATHLRMLLSENLPRRLDPFPRIRDRGDELAFDALLLLLLVHEMEPIESNVKQQQLHELCQSER